MHSLYGKHFLKLADLSTEEVASLVALAAELKAAKKNGSETPQLRGKNVALIFEKTSTRTRCAFEVGAADQGASTVFGPIGQPNWPQRKHQRHRSCVGPHVRCD